MTVGNLASQSEKSSTCRHCGIHSNKIFLFLTHALESS